MNSQSQKISPKMPIQKDALIEQLRDLGRGVPRTLVKDVVGGVASDALSSLFGTPKNKDMAPGEEVKLGQNQTKPEQQPVTHFPRREVRSNAYQETINRLRAQETEITQKINEIRFELKALMATMKQVDKEIENAVSGEMVDPGLYHLSFLDRLKTILKLLRKNLADSASWLAVMRSKKKQRTYWAMYKKKGTEFGLNHERVVATQVG